MLCPKNTPGERCKLGNNNPFRTVYYKCSPTGHIGYRSQINISNYCIKILMFGIGTI
jgi:hypothetical protein